MKRLTVYALSLSLLAASTTVLADGKRRGHSKHWRHGSHHQDHHRAPPRYHHDYGHRDQHYSPAYLGVALLGAAISYSIFHSHNGNRCSERHHDSRYGWGGGSYSQLAGCQRIERLADGRERRFDVPLAFCQ